MLESVTAAGPSPAASKQQPLRRASKTMVSMPGLERYLANQEKLHGRLFLRDKVYRFLHAPASSMGASAYAICGMLTVVASVALYVAETVEEYGDALQPHARAIDISFLTVPSSPRLASRLLSPRRLAPTAVELIATEPLADEPGSAAEPVWPSDHFGLLLTLGGDEGPASEPKASAGKKCTVM